MATVDLSTETFKEVIESNEMVIVDFWAPWCGPCRSFAPVYETAAEEHTDIVFAKVNTEEQGELAHHFGIRSIPTLMIFRENVIIFSQPGALPAGQLAEVIAKAKSLDMDDVRAQMEKQAAQQA